MLWTKNIGRKKETTNSLVSEGLFKLQISRADEKTLTNFRTVVVLRVEEKDNQHLLILLLAAL